MLPTSSPRIGGVGRRAATESDVSDRSSTVTAAQDRLGAIERFVCERCGDVIGVYEPLVVGDGRSIRTTSRAAEPQLRAGLGAHYHHACYAALALTPHR